MNASRDPHDNKFIECALEIKADAIISGDQDLLDLIEYEGIRILTTAQILRELSE